MLLKLCLFSEGETVFLVSLSSQLGDSVGEGQVRVLYVRSWSGFNSLLTGA